MGAKLIQDPSCTLYEAAAAIGVTPSVAQKIERSAINKCRAFLAAHGISPADLLDDAMPIDLDTTHAEASFDAAADHESMTC